MEAASNDAVAHAFIVATKAAIDQERRRIEHCLNQLTERQVWQRPPARTNPIGNIILHLCGNLRQWFLHGVGGEPDVRDRPAEFTEADAIPKDELLSTLGTVIDRIYEALHGVTGDTLLESRRIQGFDTNVLSAIYSTVAHLEGHALQIAYITHLTLRDRYEPFWRPEGAEQGA